MSWYLSKRLIESYENSHSLPVREGGSWEESYSDGGPSARSRSTTIVEVYCLPDKTTGPSPLSRFGTTYAPLTESLGEAVLMWFREDSRARTSPPQGGARGLEANEVDSGKRWRESSERFARALSSLKTAPCLSVEGSPSSYPILPPWGTMRNGELLARETPEPLTSGTGSGLWPTPCVPNGGRGVAHALPKGRSLYNGRGKKVQLGLEAAVRMCPTPLASDGTKGSPNQRGGSGDARLSSAVFTYPTPTRSMATIADMEQARFSGNGGRRPRYEDAKTFPTPRAPSRSGGGTGLDGGSGARSMLTEEERKQLCGGMLNPGFVEWLMGWPLGWTAFAPLGEAGPHWSSLFPQGQDVGWWEEERAPRTILKGLHRSARLRALGNGQVPAAVVLAWRVLHSEPTEKQLPLFD